MLSAPYMDNTFALNVAQTLDYCFSITFCFSVALKDVADSESRFIVIGVDAYGEQSYGVTFSGSTLYQFLAVFESTLTRFASFEGNGRDMPFVILGNKAYPIKTLLMKPLARKNMPCYNRLTSEYVVFSFPSSTPVISRSPGLILVTVILNGNTNE